MTDPSSKQSLVATFLATARGRLITALAVVVLVLGIAAEVISIMTGYYTMTKVRADAETAGAQARAATSSSVMPSSGYESSHSRYNSIKITSRADCNNTPALNTNDTRWNQINQAQCAIEYIHAKPNATGSSPFSFQFTPRDYP
jgi:hypothetical protein